MTGKLRLDHDGKGRFSNACTEDETFCTLVEISRGLAVGDVDQDGDLDLLVTNTAGKARLFRNDARKEGRWLIVRPVDPGLSRDAYGTVVHVIVGGKRHIRLAHPGYGYLSSNDPGAHFGLPKSGRIDGLAVRWPEGTLEAFPAVEPNQVVTLRKGEGE